MAWTAPATFSVSEIVTAAKLNTHVRDNLRYLKGLDGAVNIENKLRVSPASGTVPSYAQLAIGDSAELYVGSTNANTINGGGGYDVDSGVGSDVWFNYTGYNGGATRFRDFRIGNGKNGQIAHFAGATGNVGIGTAAPAARLHAVGAGGGFLFLSATAVNATLQTPVVAGTVTAFAIFFGIVRENTAGLNAIVNGSNAALSGSFTITPGGTVTFAVTAGGAITVQRTAGSNTFEVDVLVVYK